MKIKLVIIISLIIIACGYALARKPSIISSPKKPNRLCLVKKIYVAETIHTKDLKDLDAKTLKGLEEVSAREKRMNSYLEQELIKVGFEVVKDKEKADAVLSGTQGITIVTDSPALDPPEHDYNYHLTPPSNQKLWETDDEIWNTEIHVRSKLDVSEVDRMAAPKIVDKLVKDWLKSAKKAGINTGNKIQ